MVQYTQIPDSENEMKDLGGTTFKLISVRLIVLKDLFFLLCLTGPKESVDTCISNVVNISADREVSAVLGKKG